MRINKIYIDMDGVLVNLEETLIQMESPYGLDINSCQIPVKWKEHPFIYLMQKHINSHPFIWAKPTPEFSELKMIMYQWRKRGIDVEILSSRRQDLKILQ